MISWLRQFLLSSTGLGKQIGGASTVSVKYALYEQEDKSRDGFYVTNSVDGFAVLAGNRILVKDHTNPAANGICSYYSRYRRLPVFGIELQILMMMQKLLQMRLLLLREHADTAWVVTTNDAIIVGGASGTAIVWMQLLVVLL
jgi:hypothetical protein